MKYTFLTTLILTNLALAKISSEIHPISVPANHISCTSKFNVALQLNIDTVRLNLGSINTLLPGYEEIKILTRSEYGACERLAVLQAQDVIIEFMIEGQTSTHIPFVGNRIISKTIRLMSTAPEHNFLQMDGTLNSSGNQSAVFGPVRLNVDIPLEDISCITEVSRETGGVIETLTIDTKSFRGELPSGALGFQDLDQLVKVDTSSLELCSLLAKIPAHRTYIAMLFEGTLTSTFQENEKIKSISLQAYYEPEKFFEVTNIKIINVNNNK